MVQTAVGLAWFAATLYIATYHSKNIAYFMNGILLIAMAIEATLIHRKAMAGDPDAVNDITTCFHYVPPLIQWFAFAAFLFGVVYYA